MEGPIPDRETPAWEALSLLERLPNEILHRILSYLPPYFCWCLAFASVTLCKAILPLIMGSSSLSRRRVLLHIAAVSNKLHMLNAALHYGPPQTLLSARSTIRSEIFSPPGCHLPRGFQAGLVESYPASTLYLALTNRSPTESIPMIRAILANGGGDDCISKHWQNKYRLEHHVNLVPRTPLHVVGNVEVLAVLLEPRSNCRRYLNTIAYSRFTTPLAVAVASHRPLEFIEMLLCAGASPHGPFIRDCTADEIATAEAEEGTVGQAHYLGPFENTFDHHWLASIPHDTLRISHFELACEFGQLETARLLLQHGARLDGCARTQGPLRALQGALMAMGLRPQNQEKAVGFVDLFAQNGMDFSEESPLGLGSKHYVSELVLGRFLYWGAWPRVQCDDNGITASLVRQLIQAPMALNPLHRLFTKTANDRADKARLLLSWAAASEDDGDSGQDWAISEARSLLEWAFGRQTHHLQRRRLVMRAVRGVKDLFREDLTSIPIWKSLFFASITNCPLIGTLSNTADITEIIVDGGMSVEADCYGRTPLHYALRMQNLPFKPDFWLNETPDVESAVTDRIHAGRSASAWQSETSPHLQNIDFEYLRPCRMENMLRIIRSLLSAGVRVDAIDYKGLRAENYAAINGWRLVWRASMP